MVDAEAVKQGLRRVSASKDVQGDDADTENRKLRRVDAANNVRGGVYTEQARFSAVKVLSGWHRGGDRGTEGRQ